MFMQLNYENVDRCKQIFAHIPTSNVKETGATNQVFQTEAEKRSCSNRQNEEVLFFLTLELKKPFYEII